MLLILLVPALNACGLFRPTLRVAWCTTVPRPNGFVEKYPWEKAPTLTVNALRGRGDYAESRPIQVKACYDGRAISLLVRWIDRHDSLLGRFWIWNPGNARYELQQFGIDQCAILWPISKKAGFHLWDGKSAVYDVWQWRAGWSDLSGYADDRRLIVRPHPWGTSPAGLKGQLYPLGKRRGMVELEWLDDAGSPGTAAVPRPFTFLGNHVSGAVAGEGRGSVADVRAQGVYTPKLQSASTENSRFFKRESWRYTPQGDDWFVEFYRLMVTGAKEDEDCQLRGRGPFTLALAIWDDTRGDSFFLTEPIRLVLSPAGK